MAKEIFLHEMNRKKEKLKYVLIKLTGMFDYRYSLE